MRSTAIVDAAFAASFQLGAVRSETPGSGLGSATPRVIDQSRIMLFISGFASRFVADASNTNVALISGPPTARSQVSKYDPFVAGELSRDCCLLLKDDAFLPSRCVCSHGRKHEFGL